MRIAKKTIAIFLASLIFMLSIPLNVFANEQKNSIRESAVPIVIGGELIKKDSTSNKYGIDVFEVENPRNPNGPLGKFILKKTDKNSRNLKGATFLLEGNGISRTIEPKDNEEGLTIDNLSPGIYILKETEAPDGYTKTEETATITVDNAGNTSIKSDTNPSKDISVENDQKTLLSYDAKELNIVIAVENGYPKGTTERYSYYRTTAASIYDGFKNTPGLKGKVNIILAGTTPYDTKVVNFDIGSQFQFPDNNNVAGWMDQAFTKASSIFGDSPNTENILITLFEGKYYGANANKALEEVSTTNINKVFNYTYSKTWLNNIKDSLINRYNNLNIKSNSAFENMISKSMFDENRDFYVSEYITGIARDGSIKNELERGSHIKENTVAVPTVTIQNEIFGKLIINKTDKADGKELQGAEFTLIKKDGTESFTATSTEKGIATFDEIPPGEYILKETKAPDKYKKIETEWNVYVSPAGATFVNEKKDNVTPQETKGEDLSDKLNGTITLSTPQNTLTVGDNSNKITINGNFDATDVKAGDYFDLKIYKTIHYNMLQPDKPNQPTITDANREKIAVPTLIKSSPGEEKIIRYTFVKDLQSVNFSFKLDYSVDEYGAKNNGNYQFSANVGHTRGEIDRQVSYSGGKSNSYGLNIDAAFDYTNDQNGKYSQVIYVNQEGSNIKDPTHLEITPYVKNDYKNGYITANISPIATAIKVYKVKAGQSLSNAVIYEKDKLADVTGSFINKIKIEDNKATVQFDIIGNDKYVVVVDSNMIYPQGQIQGTYLAQVASLVNNNLSSRVSMTSGIATYDSYSLGTGSAYTSNKIELNVQNEKEATGKFTLKKNNENQQFIPGSEFTLSKKENEKLPESFEPVKKEIKDANGVEFTGLLPGLYILKETKSPDGYKASDDYVVIVHASGNTQVIDKKLFDIMDKSDLKEDGDPDELLNTKSTIDVEGTGSTKRDPNIFDGQLIKKLDVSDYELVSSNDKNPNKVSVNNGEYLKAKFKVKLPAQAKEGDYFYITYDDNINRLGNKMLEDKLLPIKSYLGEELITVSNKNGDNTYKYILTKAVNNKQDFEIEIETPLYVNREKIRDNSLLKITNRIPSKGKDNDSAKTVEEKVFENQISVDYSNFSQKSKTSNDYIGSAIYYNTDKVELDQTTGRPKLDEQGKPIEKTSPNPYIISYVYVYGNKKDTEKISVGLYSNSNFGSSAINLFEQNVEIEVYKVSNPFESKVSNDKLNSKSMPESFGLTEDSLKNETKLNLNKDYSVEIRNATYGKAKVLTINGDNKADDSSQYGYIIKVKAPYQIGDVPIRLVATMSRNGNFVGFQNEIIQAKPSATINYSKAIKLVKKDNSDNSKLIDGAIFKLTSVEGEEKYLQYAKTGKDPQSSNNGTLYFTKIKSGDYILEEVLTPQGYEKPSHSWMIRVNYDEYTKSYYVEEINGQGELLEKDSANNLTLIVKNKKSEFGFTSKTVINYLNKIKFYKVDENGESLKGAKFKLIRGTETIRELKSIDQNKINEFIFEKLSSGDYKLLEIQAPEGYPSVGNGLEVATFTVNARGEIENVKTYNGVALTDSDGSVHKIVNSKYKPVYPSTGGIGTFPFIGIGLSLMTIAYIELKRNKKYIILK